MMGDQREVPDGLEGPLYRVLGVAPEASHEAIVHAYRRQARSSHPDARPGDPGAAARFRMLTSAYEVLSDPVRRADYDRTGRTGTAPRPARSAGNRPGQGRPERPEEPWVGSLDFLGAGPPRLPGSHLWAGPVRVEASPRQPAAELRWPHASRRREHEDLTWLLLGFLADGWSK